MRRTNVAVLSITSFIIDSALSSWWMVLPLYLQELGASVAEVGISYAAINAAWAVSQLPGGLLSDRFGRKRVIVMCTSTFIPFFISMPILKSWLAAAIAITVSSFFAGLQNPSFSSMIAESSEGSSTARAFGFYNFLMNLGWAVGPLMGAFIIPLWGFDLLFILGALASALCLALRVLLLEEAKKAEEMPLRPSLKEFLPFLISISVFNVANGIIMPLIPIHAEKFQKFTTGEIELMFFTAQLFTSIASLIAGSIITRTGGMRGLGFSFVLSGIFSLLWFFSHSYAAFALLSLYYISYFAFAEVSFGTALSGITTRGNRATAFGTATVFAGLSNSIGSYIGGVMWESLQPVVPFLLASSLMVLSPAFLKRVDHNQ
ncbi:MAG: MFS transporter [Candidatus Methanodesulfokora sp.]